MRARIERVDADAPGGEPAPQFGMDAGEGVERQLPARDAGLIGDDDQFEAGVLEKPQSFHGSGQQFDLIRRGQVVLLDEDGTVAIEQDVRAWLVHSHEKKRCARA
jgi:hypothetical protein